MKYSRKEMPIFNYRAKNYTNRKKFQFTNRNIYLREIDLNTIYKRKFTQLKEKLIKVQRKKRIDKKLYFYCVKPDYQARKCPNKHSLNALQRELTKIKNDKAPLLEINEIEKLQIITETPEAEENLN